jgi:hypothetical protein
MPPFPKPPHGPTSPEFLVLQETNLPVLGITMDRHQYADHANQFYATLQRLGSGHELSAKAQHNAEALRDRYIKAYGKQPAILAAHLANLDANLDANQMEHGGNSMAAEVELENLVRSGDTTTMLSWLDNVADGSHHNHRNNHARVNDAHDTHSEAGRTNTSSSLQLAHTRWAIAANPLNTTFAAPTGLSPEQTKEAERLFNTEVARLAKGRTALDRELATQSSKDQLAHQKTESDRDRAVLSHKLHDGLSQRHRNLADALRTEHTEKYDKMDSIDTSVWGELASWSLTGPSVSLDQPGDIALQLDNWREHLDSLSPRDSGRVDYMNAWVKSSARLHQRRAFEASGSDPSVPVFSADRGIKVQTPDGPQTLYDDGSITRFEDMHGNITSPTDPMGSQVRRRTDGTVWAPESAPLAPAYSYDALNGLSDAQLHANFTMSLQNWEMLRTNQLDMGAAIDTHGYSDRVNEITSAHVAHVQTVQNHLMLSENSLHAAITDRTANINLILSTSPSPTDPAEIARVTADVDHAIAALQANRNAVRAEHNIAVTDLRASRTYTNGVQYWKGFFAVTQPAAAQGPADPARAHMTTHGEIAWRDTTLNGIHGNWVIALDGSAVLHNPDGSTVAYKADGEII